MSALDEPGRVGPVTFATLDLPDGRSLVVVRQGEDLRADSRMVIELVREDDADALDALRRALERIARLDELEAVA